MRVCGTHSAVTVVNTDLPLGGEGGLGLLVPTIEIHTSLINFHALWAGALSVKPGAKGPVSVMTFWTFCILDFSEIFSRNSSNIWPNWEN